MAVKQDSNDCRIPLSIKVDRGESLYQNLIAPARDEGRLTTLIIELLRAYYDDDVVRKCVDKRMEKTDELKAVQDQIERMLLEHAKNIAQTQALEFEAQQATRGTASDDTVSIDVDSGSKDAETTVEMMSMVRVLAEKVDKLSACFPAQGQVPSMMQPMVQPMMQPMPYGYNGAVYVQPQYMNMPNVQSSMNMPMQNTAPVQNVGYSEQAEKPKTTVNDVPKASTVDVAREVKASLNEVEKTGTNTVVIEKKPVESTGVIGTSTVPENPFAKKTTVVEPTVVKKESGLVINSQPAVQTVTGKPVDTQGGTVIADVNPPKKRKAASFSKTLAGLERTE